MGVYHSFCSPSVKQSTGSCLRSGKVSPIYLITRGPVHENSCTWGSPSAQPMPSHSLGSLRRSPPASLVALPDSIAV